MANLKLGLQLGYWGSHPPPQAGELAVEADRLGFDSVWTAEAYGSDALTPLAWWGQATNGSVSERRSASFRRGARRRWRWRLSRWITCRVAASCSGSGCRARRWSRDGTGSPSPSLGPHS